MPEAAPCAAVAETETRSATENGAIEARKDLTGAIAGIRLEMDGPSQTGAQGRRRTTRRRQI